MASKIERDKRITTKLYMTKGEVGEKAYMILSNAINTTDSKVQQRQSPILSMCREQEHEYVVATGKLNGKRSKGRPRDTMLDSLPL